MPLDAGTRLGAYEIVSPLGAGGMGEVYKARDTRLDRFVAIKILPESLAGDPEFRDRFEREARVISSLSHPHICPLFDVGEAVVSRQSSGVGLESPVASSEHVRFLVMEFLDGATLADEIARFKDQGLPVEDVLRLGIEIGSALDAAHRAGVVHRDLKPGNVLLTKTGAKLLDFGLAKSGQVGWAGIAGSAASRSAVSRGADLTAPPTMTTPPNITAQGTILGTFQYMAPEQVEGADADPRTDIFAFGCVLYEMLTGRKAFTGKTQVSLISAILKDAPLPISTHRAAAPPALAWVVGRCLAKDPDRRWQTASDLVSHLEWIAEGGGEAPRVEATPAPPRSTRTPWIVAAVASVVLAAAAGAGAWLLKPSPTAERPLRFSVETLDSPRALSMGSPYTDIAISPDDSHIVYTVGTGPGTTQLMVRAADQLDAVPLRAVTGANGPFFSPDGQWVGFAVTIPGAGPEMRKVSVSGGPSITIGHLSSTVSGASWGPDNTIVFAVGSRSSGLFTIPAGGGEPKALTKPDEQQHEALHQHPFVLPNGRAALFTTYMVNGGLDSAQVAVVDLKTGERKTLVRGGGQAAFVPSTEPGPGYLVYAAAGALRAARFDPVRLEVLSDPVPIVDRVAMKVTGAAQFSLSQRGTLIYVEGALNASGQGPQRSLVLVDRQGREEPIAAPLRGYALPRFSPDDSKIALDIRDQENDIWIWDRARQTLTRLTFDPADDLYPVWTPDGRRIMFASRREGYGKVYSQSADGTGSPERITNPDNDQVPYAISPEGKLVIVRQTVTYSGGGAGLGLLTLDATPHTEQLVRTSGVVENADLSPDGRWIAYQSNESGQNQVYVRSFPKVDTGRWQISTTGGTHPLWSRAGAELFYLDVEGKLMTVAVQTSPTFSALTPSRLLATAYYRATGRAYDATHDGKQFLMIKAASAVAGANQTSAGMSSPPITVVHNWIEELKKRLPAR